MTIRRQAPRGASRSPRQAGGSKPRAGSGGSRGAAARGKPQPPAGGIRKGRLLLALLVIAALVALIWFVQHRPARSVEPVPPALAKDEPKPDQAAGTAKAAEPAQNPERFEFYDILPNQQVLPTRKVDSSPPRPLPAGAQQKPKATEADAVPRWLQAGAFASADEADRRRAQIRLLGLPARVQEGTDGSGRHLHRVLAGPFNSADSLDGARRALAAAGLDAIPLSNPPLTSTGAAQP